MYRALARCAVRDCERPLQLITMTLLLFDYFADTAQYRDLHASVELPTWSHFKTAADPAVAQVEILDCGC